MTNRIRKAMYEKDQGFTLIELLVVIIIIGILAAIAIPVFLNQRKKGVDASIKSDLKSAATAAEAYAIDNPTDDDFVSQSLVPLVSASINFANGGFKKTPGNWTYFFGGPAGGYCLSMGNTGGSGTGTTRYVYYDSLNGGLQPGFHSQLTGPCSVPGSSLAGSWLWLP